MYYINYNIIILIDKAKTYNSTMEQQKKYVYIIYIIYLQLQLVLVHS